MNTVLEFKYVINNRFKGFNDGCRLEEYSGSVYCVVQCAVFKLGTSHQYNSILVKSFFAPFTSQHPL